MLKWIINALFPLISFQVASQTGEVYKNLPVGKFQVGFKIVTLTDSSRIVRPLHNYLGEKDLGDRYKKIRLHIWYPAIQNSGKGILSYGEYAYNERFSFTTDSLTTSLKNGMLAGQRETFQGFFGKLSDEQWNTVMGTRLLARKDATPVKQKFPLLIGMLRPLSTSVTNELMASNGYVVVMVLHSGGTYPLQYISDITDMQEAMRYMSSTGMIDDNAIGAYGFSGSGFSQVLLTMYDHRIKALADLESGLYMDGLWTLLANSDFYNHKRMKVPFLHIFSRDLSREEKFINEYDNQKYSDRYRLILNPAGLHHWDFATEGRFSTTVVHTRGEKEEGIKGSYEISNVYLLHFFNAILKNDNASKQIISNKNSIRNYHDSLWSITHTAALKTPPDVQQFTEIILKKGIDTALQIANTFFKTDTSAEFLHQNVLNQLARDLRRQDKLKEALLMMKFVSEIHPEQAWIWNNRASMEEDFGSKEVAIMCSEKALALLADFKGSEQSFNARIQRSSAERLKRLKIETGK